MLALVAAGLTVGSKAGAELGLDPRITAVLGATGGVLGLVAGNVTNAGSAWTTIAQVAGAVQGGVSAAAGGATVVEGQYRSDAVDHRADAMAAQSRQNDAWFRLDLAIEMLDRACREVSHATERASDVVRDDNNGRSAVISRIGAA